ncbi:MAG: hypothetical protein ACLQVI_12885 [Polyangiaceae bacterium]|jgi:hypothetical protein
MGRFSKIARFSAVALAFSTTALAEQPPSAPAASGPKPVTVVLQSDDRHAMIERQKEVQSLAGIPLKDATILGVSTWEPACVAPCATPLDPRFSYRVAGDGLVPSESFTLPQDRDHLKLDAKMGSSIGRVGGGVLGLAGVGGILLGAAALIATPILENQNAGSPTLRTGVLAGGVVVSGAGVIALVAGVWLWLHNDTTVRQEQEEGRATARSRVTAGGIAF